MPRQSGLESGRCRDGPGAFLTRRLNNVRAEFRPTVLVYTVRRAFSLVGPRALIAAADTE